MPKADTAETDDEDDRMKTDDLISMLAQDAAPPAAAPIGQRAGIGIGAGFALAIVLYALVLGPRPDLGLRMADPVVLAKTLLPLVLSGLALVLGLRAVRPGAAAGPVRHVIWAVPAALAGLVVWALITTPRGEMLRDWLGHSIPVCLPAITILSMPILAGLLTALKRGAPTRPARAGMLAGLASAGLATALYSTFCVEDSPLFYATWYTTGILIATAVGGWVGARVLRW